MTRIAVNAAPVSWTANDSTVLRVIEWGGGTLPCLAALITVSARRCGCRRFSVCPSGLRSAVGEPPLHPAEARPQPRGACVPGDMQDLEAEAQIGIVVPDANSR